MLRTLTTAFLFIGLIAGSQSGFAKSKRVRLVAQHKVQQQKGSWHIGKNTMVSMRDLGTQDASACKAFDVVIDDSIRFNIECAGESKIDKLSLHRNKRHTVTRHHNQLTVTKYNYLLKKPQTSRMSQASLKIPYVEEIIHIKYQASGELAFYLEKFKVDEFGRIVQDSFIQVYGLSAKNLKISSTK